MKTKFYWFALLASAALIAQAQAGGHHGGGGFVGGGFVGGARAGRGPSFYGGGPMRSFGGGRNFYPGQRFYGMRSPSGFSHSYINPYRGSQFNSQRFTRGNFNRPNNTNRFANANARPGLRNGSSLRSDWRSHAFAQHSANWHRDWDRHHDHFFHGHRFAFIDGSWWGFDLGWDPWWWYGYPYDYYGYYPYPYGYGADYYGSDGYQGEEYQDQNNYGDQPADSTVSSAQERLAREGYYRGQIDGVLGRETQRAISRYQSNHGLPVTGALTPDTVRALGLRQVASY